MRGGLRMRAGMVGAGANASHGRPSKAEGSLHTPGAAARQAAGACLPLTANDGAASGIRARIAPAPD